MGIKVLCKGSCIEVDGVKYRHHPKIPGLLVPTAQIPTAEEGSEDYWTSKSSPRDPVFHGERPCDVVDGVCRGL